MIHYQLRCTAAHEFDGWFKDSAAFEQQAARGLVECPTCGGSDVQRALMAPAVATRAEPRAVPAEVPAVSPAPEKQGGKLPAHVMAMLQRVRAEVEKHCDYVGRDFAEEARKIHRGESDRRGIYGESSPTEVAALADEGIEISQIPWVPRSDG